MTPVRFGVRTHADISEGGHGRLRWSKVVDMKLHSTPSRPFIPVLLLALVGGCASTSGSIDPANYDKMTCAELNSAIGEAAKDISQTAITRGKVASTSVPRWLLGGSSVKAAVANRETTRIDRLKQQQAAMAAARARKCPGLAS